MDTQPVLKSYETLQPGFQRRPATMGDLEATAHAIEANFQHLTGRKLELLDTIHQWWQEPGFNLATDSQIVLTPQGGIAGYCEVWDVLDPPVKMNLWLQVHCGSSSSCRASRMARAKQGGEVDFERRSIP